MVDEHGRAVRPFLVFVALAMAWFAIGTTEFATMSLLPYFSDELGIDEPTAGHVICAYALGVVGGAPLLAVLSARPRRRTLLLLLMPLLALGNGLSALAPGFGGLFAVYTYLASTLMEVTGMAPSMVPMVLCVFGLGMTIGNLAVPRLADRALMPTAGGLSDAEPTIERPVMGREPPGSLLTARTHNRSFRSSGSLSKRVIHSGPTFRFNPWSKWRSNKQSMLKVTTYGGH